MKERSAILRELTLDFKRCSKCKVEKPLDSFGNKKSTKDGKQFYCKVCRADIENSYTHKPCVYYIPEHHYVGVSSNITKRMSDHRNNSGRITEGYEILAYFEREVDAHMLETMLHQRGYNGYRKL